MSSVPSTDADACGGYGSDAPQVHMVAGHGGRTFVLMGAGTSTRSHRWSRVDGPTSYDHTMIAPAPELERAITLTLVGPGGTRVVSTRSQWLLDPSWRFRGVHSVVEVQSGTRDFRVALVGDLSGARWTELAYPEQQGKATDVAWLKANNIAVPTSVFVSVLPKTGFELLTITADTTVTTAVRKDGQLVRQVSGNPAGAVTVNGRQYLVVETQGRARMIELV